LRDMLGFIRTSPENEQEDQLADALTAAGSR
jgi:hypothetical protein